MSTENSQNNTDTNLGDTTSSTHTPQNNKTHDKATQHPTKNHKETKKFTSNINKSPNKIAENFAELEQLKSQLDHVKSQFHLAVADKENIKRLMKQNIDDAVDRAMSNFIREILVSCDNLENAIQNLKEDDSIHEGISMTWKELVNTLERNDIKRMYPLEEKFNPQFHKAVSQIINDDNPSGTILKVIQPGYTFKAKLIRPASVIISKTSKEE
ncbi:nucleotide exchange factor GrpE [Neoehrlichia mikurensis]|uniref:Protein GrpE n=1 Tax=Neoehrlichia mikurensis TaxID=89586 RepID=A0A9Q9BWM5_9RICK|nr:nucleotide exchange factor GrpE [Neoehrlichia mikurensis]QXK92233.1 nucleotide exchange factor GrpE [Neoehrlichia mikurensis]QXK92688.1 nucleotide exchange factor GrpE [Neoehrlichia mikurensis]QXK93926.1 nucleotide exchange factor GrpE [Neoehrlichia mikurensis]UTO55913.1 nucleotide exchange factor GrpE [Neoehrlichia mikurensis]UTO56829.1 nucleotide exchange factor GrpE [Neoehrlichia mikurensis]